MSQVLIREKFVLIMLFLKTLLLEISRPVWCSLAGIKRAITFKYYDLKERKAERKR